MQRAFVQVQVQPARLARAAAIATVALVVAIAVSSGVAAAAPAAKCYNVGGRIICDPVQLAHPILKPNPCLSCPQVQLNPGDLITQPAINVPGLQQQFGH